jgi:hypothetical protein
MTRSSFLFTLWSAAKIDTNWLKAGSGRKWLHSPGLWERKKNESPREGLRYMEVPYAHPPCVRPNLLEVTQCLKLEMLLSQAGSFQL